MCPDQKNFIQITQNVNLSEKGRELFRIFKFLWIISIYNVKIHFLTNFSQKILILEKVTTLFIFTDFQGHRPGVKKNAVGTF